VYKRKLTASSFVRKSKLIIGLDFVADFSSNDSATVKTERDRLEKAARIAHKGKFEAFTTTLLYSKFQQHEKICELGRELGRRFGIKFYYEDFREGWREGIELSKEKGMYRQQYCGCIYSEGERYLGAKKLYG